MNKELGPVELSHKILDFFATFDFPEETTTFHEVNIEIDKCMEAQALITNKYHKGIISVIEWSNAIDMLDIYLRRLEASSAPVENENL